MNPDFENRAFVHGVISAATVAASRVWPSWDRGTYFSALATECFSAGETDTSAPLLDMAVSCLEPDHHPLVRATALISVANAFHNCKRIDQALEMSSEANEVLSLCADTAASLPEAMLAMLLARLDRESVSRDLASRIIRRSKNLPGSLAQLTVGHAFRVYVALNEFARAEEMLKEELPPETCVALTCSAFDLFHKKPVDEATCRRADWIECATSNCIVASAVLMRWHAESNARDRALRLWTAVARGLEKAGSRTDKLDSASIACLALRKSGEMADAQALFERIKDWFKESALSDLLFSTREHLARSYAAFGDLQSAIKLNVVGSDAPPEGVIGAIVSQLCQDNQSHAAFELIRTSDERLLARLICRCAFELLRNRDRLRDLNPAELQALASKL
jgi:tetratricopeptide (TPR) repeat protein